MTDQERLSVEGWKQACKLLNLCEDRGEDPAMFLDEFKTLIIIYGNPTVARPLGIIKAKEKR